MTDSMDRLIPVVGRSRPTEVLAERLMASSQGDAIQWRKTRWGSVRLTEREYEAVVYEADAVRQRTIEYRRAEQVANDAHAERMANDAAVDYAVFLARREMGFYEAQREAHLDRLQSAIARGVQGGVASKMGISQQRVSQLLKSASVALAYLADHSDSFVGFYDANAGLVDRLTGEPLPERWVLEAPVNKVKHAQIIEVNFEPQRLLAVA